MNRKEFEEIFKDYKISNEDLQKLHDILLNMLTDLDRICRENNIKYSLAGGSLLGAIRHKGFIPWDDDVDVVMPHPDYEKFIDIVGKKYNNEYEIADIRKGTASTLFVKFCKKDTKCVEIYNCGTPFSDKVFIDIFPTEYCPEDLKERKSRGKKFNLYRKMLLCAIAYRYPSKLMLEKCKTNKNLRKEYRKKRFLGFISNIFGYKRLIKKCDKLSHYNEKTSQIVIPFGARYYDFELYNADFFDNLIEVPFEDRKFLITHRYEEYLRLMYKDYMQLPPEENRHPLHTIKVLGYKEEYQNIAVILSSGKGERFGMNIPKQYFKVNGKMIVEYVVNEVCKSNIFDKVLLMIDPMYQNKLGKYSTMLDFVKGGEHNRNETISNAINYIKENYPKCKKVVFLDSVRPNINRDFLKNCLMQLDTCDAVITTQKITDSLGKSDCTFVNREEYYLIQTPECFKFNILCEDFNINDLSKTAIVQHLKENRTVCKNFNLKNNIKITYKDDIKVLKSILKRK